MKYHIRVKNISYGILSWFNSYSVIDVYCSDNDEWLAIFDNKMSKNCICDNRILAVLYEITIKIKESDPEKNWKNMQINQIYLCEIRSYEFQFTRLA